MNKMDSGTLTRTILLVLALVNQGLILAGYQPFNVDEEGLYNFISMAFLAVTSLLAWWKNNSVTYEARLADREMKKIKAKKKYVKATGSPIKTEYKHFEGNL